MKDNFNDIIKEISITTNDSIAFAFRKMDAVRRKLLLVFEGGTFKGLLSIGDIQRSIIKNISLDSSVALIMRNNFRFANTNQSVEEIKKLMLNYRTEFMPALDNDGVLKNVIFWEDIMQEQYFSFSQPFNLPIVIMAGGKGTRLKPLTNILPKPLIPIGEKTIIEDIMDKFVLYGSNKFYLSVNYKANFIRDYFKNLDNSQYIINYFQEKKPLGTAGSLKLLNNKIKSTFFVSNCDIIINEDYSQILAYHLQNKNDLTLVTALKNYEIPYGVVETEDDGLLSRLIEKPEITFKINTGMYILEPYLLNEIPENEFFHITHLIEKIKNKGGRVGCFPISDKSWIDIGEWNEYLKLIKIN